MQVQDWVTKSSEWLTSVNLGYSSGELEAISGQYSKYKHTDKPKMFDQSLRAEATLAALNSRLVLMRRNAFEPPKDSSPMALRFLWQVNFVCHDNL